MNRLRKNLLRHSPVLLAAAIVLLAAIGFEMLPAPAAALSSDEIQEQIDELEEQREELLNQMNELSGQIDENVTEIRDIVDQKYIIDRQVALLHQQIQNINDQISSYSRLIADKQEELDAAQDLLQELNSKNKERIRAMEENGQLSYWSVLFKSNSFSDLLDRLSMMEEIAASDQRRLKEMNETALLVENAKAQLETQKAGLEKNRQELADAEDILEQKRIESEEYMKVLIERGEEFELLMYELSLQEEDFITQIGLKEQEYNEAVEEEYQQWLSTSEPEFEGGPSSGPYFPTVEGEGWLIPVDYVYVSSGYGWREPPVDGASTFHGGVDLAAYYGNPIYATRSGTVTTAASHWSLGEYVTINHGDGFSSMYCHMTHFVVSEGEYVQQGQVIGYVGLTGTTNGPHLHFVIYYEGETVNPEYYLGL